MKYNQPFSVSDPDASYINGNPAAGIRGSIPPGAAMEQAQREIVKVIVEAGITPSNDDLTQLWQAIKGIAGSIANLTVTNVLDSLSFNLKVPYGAVAGTNSLTVALDPAPASYFAGLMIETKILTDNTDVVQINCNALGNVPCKRLNGMPLLAHDLQGGTPVLWLHDGTNFRLVGSPSITSFQKRFRDTTPGTRNFTATVTGWHRITMVAAGGGGGSASGLSEAGGGAGGGASFQDYRFLIAGSVTAYTVGALGAGHPGPDGAGSAGGLSSWDNAGSMIVAGGGLPGGAGSGGGFGGNRGLVTGVSSDGLARPGYSGYQGQNVLSPIEGGHGGNAGTLGGGPGGIQSNGGGNPGSPPGGGGGGSVLGAPGGNGADGELMVEW